MPNNHVPAAAAGLPKICPFPPSGRDLAAPPEIVDLESAVDPVNLPDRYILEMLGDHMLPGLSDGAMLLFSKSERIVHGDTVVLWTLPELVSAAMPEFIVVDMPVAFPPFIRLPLRVGQFQETTPLVVIAFRNPSMRSNIDLGHFAAVHKCLGSAFGRPRLVPPAPAGGRHHG